jgi:DNA topoisomerase-1
MTGMRRRHQPLPGVEGVRVTVDLEAARRAHLRWVNDAAPGIGRRKHGDHFRYARPDGSPVRDAETLSRIRALAIPPAWTDVWICVEPLGHIQATGRDARGRKQYRYHTRWREARDESKYDRTIEFAEALPRIRAQVDADLRRRGLQRERVLAAVVRLLDLTLIRIGNAEYAKENKSFGLTTLRASHVAIDGDNIRLSFRGKGGKRVTADVHDRRVAAVMERCTTLPGEELFQYVDDEGAGRTVSSDDVNTYLREIGGGDFSAKDFRTWAGTVITARSLRELGACATTTEEKRRMIEAVREAATHLGNTVAVCRRCYVHPHVLNAYSDGSLLNLRFGGKVVPRNDPSSPAGLRADERAVLRLLRSARAPARRERRRSA